MENDTKQTQPAQNNEKQNNTVMAILSYLGVLILIPLLLDAKKDPFIKFHIKQGLVLVIFEVITWVIESLPFGFMIAWLLGLITLIFIIIGVMNAAQGREQELPFIGMYAKSFNF